ncbi:hypothetical protein [Kineosporia mesophila]|nr:hypothetical protein [Kineosporia mesophila]MCD5350287.1 hypothetical protein [Kineosporia mesophila]
MADLGGDPEAYGDRDVLGWAPAPDEELGGAFVEPLRQLSPELLPELADVDLGGLDFGAIGREVRRSAADPKSWV